VDKILVRLRGGGVKHIMKIWCLKVRYGLGGRRAMFRLGGYVKGCTTGKGGAAGAAVGK
jgi:hypothetical protein